jgi:predicted small metal-binding protein
MTKSLHCRDLGFDCDATVTAESEDEVMNQVVAHGQAVHNIPAEQFNDQAFVETVRAQIHDEDEARQS